MSLNPIHFLLGTLKPGRATESSSVKAPSVSRSAGDLSKALGRLPDLSVRTTGQLEGLIAHGPRYRRQRRFVPVLKVLFFVAAAGTFGRPACLIV